MADAHVEIGLAIDAEQAWQVVGDFEQGPVRMAPGFVATCHGEGEVREVEFVDGSVAVERLITRDDARRRIVYAVVGGTVRPEHDTATMQVLEDGPGRSRLVWTHDVLPHGLAEPMSAAMQRAAGAISRGLGADRAAPHPGSRPAEPREALDE